MKLDFLHIYLTMFSESVPSKIQIYEVHLLLKMLKIQSRFQKMQQKIEKKLFVSEIIASEFVSLNCLY